MSHSSLELKFGSMSLTKHNSLVKGVLNFLITFISCMVLICLLVTIIGREVLQLQFKIQYYFCFGNII